MAESAARKALTLLDAVDAPTGRLPVVVGNGFGGVLLHEAVGHGLEADAVQKRASVYAGRMGDQLAQPGVVAYDDGALQNEWGSDGIDDEGTPDPAHDRDRGRQAHLVPLRRDPRPRRRRRASTGNGRRESFRHLPIPRMTNTYFAPGDATPEELIAGVERGLYAVSFGGGQVEPATGDFVFGVSEGYLIEGGKVTAPVRGATLVGNGIEALAAVDGDRRRPRASPPATAARPASGCRRASASPTSASASSRWEARRRERARGARRARESRRRWRPGRPTPRPGARSR